MTFDILIDIFCLFINDKMKNDWHINLNTQSSTYVFSNHWNELRIFIRNNCVKQLVKMKDILNYYINNFLRTEILFVILTKYIMIFFNSTMNNNINNIVILRWKEINGKIFNDISSALLRNE